MSLHCKFIGKFQCIVSKFMFSFPPLYEEDIPDRQEGKERCPHSAPACAPHPMQGDGERHHRQEQQPKARLLLGRTTSGRCRSSFLPLGYKRFPWISIPLSCRAEAAGNSPRRAALDALHPASLAARCSNGFADSTTSCIVPRQGWEELPKIQAGRIKCLGK